MATKDNSTKTLRHLSLDGIKNQYNIEAEVSLLSAMMLEPDVAQVAVTALSANDFYDNRHYYIFQAMSELVIESQPLTLPALSDKLEHSMTKGKKPQRYIDVIGGYDYLYEIFDTMPSAAGYEQYIDIVKRYSTMRSLLKASFDIASKASTSDDADDALNFAEKAIFDISQNQTVGDMQIASGALESVLNKLNEIHRNKSNVGGVKTGFRRLDRILNGGFHESDLVLIAARPACGKTSFAMNIAANMVMSGKSVAVFSLEMPYEQLMIRMLFSLSKQNISQGLSGTLSDESLAKVMEAGKKLIGKKLYINDSAATNPMDILSKCRRLKNEKGLDCIVVDYLQLMHLEKIKENRQQEVSEMSRLMKLAAKELKIPIILLSQMSRAVESRENIKSGLKPKPQLSDLRESGAIEQDADIVMFLYTQQTTTDLSPVRPVNLMIAKHRNGQIGEIPMIFNSPYVTFSEDEQSANTEGAPQENGAQIADRVAEYNNAESQNAEQTSDAAWEDTPSEYSTLKGALTNIGDMESMSKADDGLNNPDDNGDLPF